MNSSMISAASAVQIGIRSRAPRAEGSEETMDVLASAPDSASSRHECVAWIDTRVLIMLIKIKRLF